MGPRFAPSKSDSHTRDLDHNSTPPPLPNWATGSSFRIIATADWQHVPYPRHLVAFLELIRSSPFPSTPVSCGQASSTEGWQYRRDVGRRAPCRRVRGEEIIDGDWVIHTTIANSSSIEKWRA
uniref:Uncharacterized protein n=1 Tax=Oryza brachyantha TaxID=4533 RepID=J3MS23_ORYBR